MPNWVKNIIHIEGSTEDIAKVIDLIRDKKVEGDVDFNNVVPMPERLNIISGGYDKYYVALYLKTLSECEKLILRSKLSKREVFFYKNYFKKYEEYFDNRFDIPEGHLKRMRDRFEEDYKGITPETMEDVGKTYIDNILEYGHDTWYEWCCDNWGTKWNATESVIGDNYLEFQTAWSAPFPVIAALSHKFPELIFRHEWADEDLGRNCGRREFRNGVVVYDEEFKTGGEAHDFACMMWGYDPEDDEDE